MPIDIVLSQDQSLAVASAEGEIRVRDYLGKVLGTLHTVESERGPTLVVTEEELQKIWERSKVDPRDCLTTEQFKARFRQRTGTGLGTHARPRAIRAMDSPPHGNMNMVEIVLNPEQADAIKNARGQVALKDRQGNLLGLTTGIDPETPVLTPEEWEMLARRRRDLPADLSTLPTTAEVLRRIKSQVRS